jgi:hypothetical protein
LFPQSPRSPAVSSPMAGNTDVLKRAARVHAAIRAQQASLTVRQAERDLRVTTTQPGRLDSPARSSGAPATPRESVEHVRSKLQEMRTALSSKQVALNKLLDTVETVSDPGAVAAAVSRSRVSEPTTPSVAFKTTMSSIVKQTPKFVRQPEARDPLDVGTPEYNMRSRSRTRSPSVTVQSRPYSPSRGSSQQSVGTGDEVAVKSAVSRPRSASREPNRGVDRPVDDRELSRAVEAAVKSSVGVSASLNMPSAQLEEKMAGSGYGMELPQPSVKGVVVLSSGLQRLKELRERAQQVGALRSTAATSANTLPAADPSMAARRITKEPQSMQPPQLVKPIGTPVDDMKRPESRASSWSSQSGMGGGMTVVSGFARASPWSTQSTVQATVTGGMSVAPPPLSKPLLTSPFPQPYPTPQPTIVAQQPYSEKPKLTRRPVTSQSVSQPWFAPSHPPAPKPTVFMQAPTLAVGPSSPGTAQRNSRLARLFG